jgi:hypothetical protein
MGVVGRVRYILFQQSRLRFLTEDKEARVMRRVEASPDDQFIKVLRQCSKEGNRSSFCLQYL